MSRQTFLLNTIILFFKSCSQKHLPMCLYFMLDLNVPLQLIMCSSKHATCITVEYWITFIFPLPDSVLGGWFQSSQQTFLFDLYHTDQNACKLLGVLFLCSLNSSPFSKAFPHLSQSSKIEVKEDLEDGLEKGKGEHKEKMRNKSINGRTKSER